MKFASSRASEGSEENRSRRILEREVRTSGFDNAEFVSSAGRSAESTDRYLPANEAASSGDIATTWFREGNRSTRAELDITVAKAQELKVLREVPGDFGGFAVQELAKFLARLTNAGADEVFLILPSELTAGNHQKRPRLTRREVSRSHAKTHEPNVEVLFELDSFEFLQIVVAHKRKMNQSQGVLENRSDL